MAGQFIISFDCEGKWGMADHLGPLEHSALDDASLAEAYDRLVSLLGRYGTPATFAFVMAFVLDRVEREEFGDLLRPIDQSDAWMNDAMRERAAHPEGWFVPSSLARVIEGGIHEVACHGFSHRSLGEGEISASGVDRELEAAAAVASRKGLRLETMIFPRNRVGHLTALQRHGYRGYRTRRQERRLVPSPVANLAEEFNPLRSAEHVLTPQPGEIVAIPHGHFFNWRHGMRRAVPPAMTVWRWRAMLDQAANRGRVAHLWLHPHNFITGPGTWKPFELVLAHACRLREAGRLQIVTQADYCSAVSAPSPPRAKPGDGAAG